MRKTAVPSGVVCLSALALVACGGYEDADIGPRAQFLDPKAEIAIDEDDVARLSGSFDLVVSLDSTHSRDHAEVVLESLWLVDDGGERTIVDDMRVLQDGAFPLDVEAGGTSVAHLRFTAAGVGKAGDALAWACGENQRYELDGSLFDLVSGRRTGVTSFNDDDTDADRLFELKRAPSPDEKLPLTSVWSKSRTESLAPIGLLRAGDDLIAAGNFEGQAFFQDTALIAGTQNRQIFLVRFDEQGKVVFQRDFGSEGPDALDSITAAPAGDLLLSGSFLSTIHFGDPSQALTATQSGVGLFLARLSPSGDHLSSRGFEITDVAPDGVECLRASLLSTQRPDGSTVLAASVAGTIDLGSGPVAPAEPSCARDFIVAALDPAGAPLFSKRFGDSKEQAITDLAIDAAGKIWMAGYSRGNLDLGVGSVLKNTGFSTARIFLAAFAPDGAPLLLRDLGQTEFNPDIPYKVHLEPRPGGGVIVAADFLGSLEPLGIPASAGDSPDGFVAALSDQGDVAWLQHIRQEAGVNLFSFQIHDLAVSKDGRVAITGRATSFVDFEGGSFAGSLTGIQFAIAFDAAGKSLGSRTLGCAPQSAALRFDDEANDLLLMGAFEGWFEREGGAFDFQTKSWWLGRLGL